MSARDRLTGQVLDVSVDVVDWDQAVGRIFDWGSRRESRYVCICNVHSVVTSGQDEEFGRVVAQADMATPDGAPVAWMLRKLGFAGQQRINGPDLMWRCCAEAERLALPVYFYGSTPATLTLLEARLRESFPNIVITGCYSPPFRPMSVAENRADAQRINASGAAVVFVSLGCPKQELWMANQRGEVNAVMIGVGAAFDFHAGTVKRAPLWMQHGGLEWLHRLASEPLRLWRRYFVTNTIFVIAAFMQLYKTASLRNRGRYV
jgi:N-acetylglucosaminyldiphosphoundecaprenol N-acetyl-beta-D-mannosaminyltransferase